jgi:HTH-type transcriptional regulator, competence development regulator
LNLLGQLLREQREGKSLLLRHLAAFLEVDTAFITKIETGEKKASREQVTKLAELLEVEKDKLITLWLCGKAFYALEGEPLSEQALKLTLKNTRNNATDCLPCQVFCS